MKAISSFLACIAILTCFTITSVAAVYKFNPASGTSAKNKVNWRSSCATPGSTFPGVSDTIQFDGSCSNANCVFDTTFNVAKINVKSNYSGTISASGSITLTFGIGIFDGGTFNGGSVPLTFNVSLKIDGCSFTSSASSLNSYGDFTFKSGGFAHNNGTVIFHRYTETTTTIGGTSNGSSTLTLYKAEFTASSQNSIFRIRNITVEVVNEMKLTGNYHLLLNTNSSSVIEVQGNIVSSNTATVGGGDCLIIINGTGSQTLSDTHGTTGTGKLCNMKIDKSSGTLSLAGNIAIGGSTTWEYVDGTVNEGTARLICDYNNTLVNNSGGEMKFAKLDMVGDGGTHTIDGRILVTDTFSTSNTGDCDINGDTLELQGDVVWDNTSSGSNGNVFFKFSGGADQIVSGQSTIQFDKVKLIKSDGNITLNTPVSITTDIVFVTGKLMSDTINLVTIKHGATATGASENSFIAGAVKKIGSSSFLFPVGKDTIYNPISITAASSATDAFRAEYFNYTQPHGFDKDSLTYLSGCEYWNIVRTAGSSNVKIELNWNASSCNIYVLSTLRIARWDGVNWNNTGPVTTTGTITAGTIQTGANQSLFGDFVIAKRSPAVIANAGSNATINLGSTASLGGAPTASGGISPFTYQWIPDYALSNSAAANPVAKPFSTYTYYLKVTDAEGSTDIDTTTITVNGFDLKSALRFPLLTNDTLLVTSDVSVIGAVGVKNFLSGNVIATDSILINTSNSNLAVRHLDTAIQKIDGFSASTLSATLNGLTVTEGVYRVSTNATLNGTITFEGNSSSYFVIDIDGNLSVSDNSVIELDGIQWNQVFIRAGNVTITGDAELNGFLLLSGSFHGNISGGNCWLMANGTINGEFNLLPNLINMTFDDTHHRSIDNYFGLNASNVTQQFGLGSEEWIENINGKRLPELHTRVLRFPGGSDANWWRWQTGWFRGYNNPAYNDDEAMPGIKYGDNLPMPEYCLDGLPWDLNSKKWQPNGLLDFKEMLTKGSCFPMFDLNMLSSDAGTEIGALFYAHCNNIPVKYIELGNEFALEGEEAFDLYPTSYEYFEKMHHYSSYIKEFFPDVKIAAVSTTSKGLEPDRRNTWNDGLQTFLTALGTQPEFNALTFHVYPSLFIDKANFQDCNLELYMSNTTLMGQILSTPYKTFDDLENNEFQILDQSTYNFEGWITEYNQEDDQYNFHGRWAHGLFTTLMTLRALENSLITKVTCFELIHSANRDVVFSDEKAFSTNTGACNAAIEYPEAIQWEFGAVGKALRYVGLATQNALSARSLNFPNAPTIPGKDQDRPGVYGWLFSNVAYPQSFSALDSNWVVVLNLSPSGVYLEASTIFPLGGEYVVLRQKEDENSPYEFIYDVENQLLADEFVAFNGGPSSKSIINLPKYSLLFIRNTIQPAISAPHIQVTNTTACLGKKVYFYLSATGAESFAISPSNGIEIDYTHPSVVARVTAVALETEYTVVGVSAFGIEGPPSYVTITASKQPLVDPTVTGSPACPESEIELDANAVGSLLYNWYPAAHEYGQATFLDTEVIAVNPVEDITYTVNITNGSCYCSSPSLFVDVYDNADAGPDVYICADPPGSEQDVVLGALDSYSGDPGISWTKELETDPALNFYDIAKPVLNTTEIAAGTYTYTLAIEYTGTSSCELTDEVKVTVVDCCSGTTGDLVFNPYLEQYGEQTYLTSQYLWNYFVDELNELQIYTDENFDVSCGGVTDEQHAIIGYDHLVINGPFYIDQNLALIKCTIEFGADAQIIIEPNARLYILGSTLIGCSEYMWQGINIVGNLDQDAGLTIGPSCEGTVEYSYIKDAEYGVFSAKDSRLNLELSYFDKNLHHIWLENYRFAVDRKISFCDFDKTGIMLLLPDFTPTQPIHGIYMNDIPGLKEVGKNVFNNSEFGMYAEFCKFITKENTMTNVETGIYSVNAQGDQTIDDNDIEDCETGISLIATNSFEIQVTRNTIITNPVDDSSPVGIYVNDLDEEENYQAGNINIGGFIGESYGNTIILNGLKGIEMIGAAESIVDHNIIRMPVGAVSDLMWGIDVNKSPESVVQYNKVNDPEYGSYSVDCNPTSECTTANKISIRILDSKDCDIICNRTNATNIGLQFLKSVDDGISLSAKVRGNTFQWHNDGLTIGGNDIDNTKIGGQPVINDETPGNYWKGNGSGIFGSGWPTNGATHTFDTNNGFSTFVVNDDTYDDGLFFTDQNATTSGTAVNIDPQDAPHFGCELGEDQGKIANNHLKSLSECCVLYPNPTDLIINFQFGSLNDECEFSVIDMAGQQLINKLIEVQEFPITFSYKLPYSGIYIAILKNSNGIIYQQKIVVLHE